jgi:arabinofuranosyltransferase
MLPLGAYLIFNGYDNTKNRVKVTLIMFLPLFLWTIFSLLYYGAAFPNTAYAKIFTGIPRGELIVQGFKYCWVTLVQDPITILLIMAAILLPLFVKENYTKYVSVALLLNLLYIVWVGGDFMRGRFFFASYVLAVICLVMQLETLYAKACSQTVCYGAVVFYIAYIAIFPFTPLNTGLNYTNFNLSYGIADERGYYFDVCSLYSYLYAKPDKVFPDFEWSHLGKQIARSKVNYLENDFNGMLGYWAGTRPIIIDRLGLADPLLSRLPVSDKENWRIGHFKREVPDEYRQSIEKGENLFKQPLHELYRLVSLATKSKDFFSLERIGAVIKLNLGIY